MTDNKSNSTKCANCGATEKLEIYSVDMDIPPVTLCALCYIKLFWMDYTDFKVKKKRE